MKNIIRKRNTPVATLIKNFCDKKSGKIVDSRKEILTRFEHLDWKDQKKIIAAFLKSGRSDRHWAYARCLEYWDESFQPILQELWDILHEERCSWAMLRHFPLEYLKEHKEEFTGHRSYFFICLRLAVDKNFVIEKDKLSLTDYLAVLYHTHRSISEDEASDILFRIVHKRCVEKYRLFSFELDQYVDIEKLEVVSPKHFRSVSVALYYLKKMEMFSVVEKFLDWNEAVESSILESDEYDSTYNNSFLRPYQYRTEAICMARKYAYLALDDKYKQTADPDIENIRHPEENIIEVGKMLMEAPARQEEPSEPNLAALEEMMAQNPTLGKLIDKLWLKTDNNTLPS